MDAGHVGESEGEGGAESEGEGERRAGEGGPDRERGKGESQDGVCAPFLRLRRLTALDHTRAFPSWSSSQPRRGASRLRLWGAESARRLRQEEERRPGSSLEGAEKASLVGPEGSERGAGESGREHASLPSRPDSPPPPPRRQVDARPVALERICYPCDIVSTALEKNGDI